MLWCRSKLGLSIVKRDSMTSLDKRAGRAEAPGAAAPHSRKARCLKASRRHVRWRTKFRKFFNWNGSPIGDPGWGAAASTGGRDCSPDCAEMRRRAGNSTGIFHRHDNLRHMGSCHRHFRHFRHDGPSGPITTDVRRLRNIGGNTYPVTPAADTATVRAAVAPAWPGDPSRSEAPGPSSGRARCRCDRQHPGSDTPRAARPPAHRRCRTGPA